MSGEDSAVPVALVESRILIIRGQKVLLDRDLAKLYQVKPIALRQQVRRNTKRFPADFMFELTDGEVEALLSQNVIPSRQNRNRRSVYAALRFRLRHAAWAGPTTGVYSAGNRDALFCSNK
jgi:hypothetical protein